MNRLTTSIYNVLVESGTCDPRFAGDDTWQMAGGFANLLETGGDALIWTLIRIGLDECLNEDAVGLCERRGYGVYRTSLVDNADPFAPPTLQ